jgi:hypothetical protein
MRRDAPPAIPHPESKRKRRRRDQKKERNGKLTRLLHPPELLHELLVDDLPPGRVDHHGVVPLRRGFLHGQPRDLRRIRIRPHREDVDADRRSKDFELLDRGRAVHVRGAEEDAAVALGHAAREGGRPLVVGH